MFTVSAAGPSFEAIPSDVTMMVLAFRDGLTTSLHGLQEYLPYCQKRKFAIEDAMVELLPALVNKPLLVPVACPQSCALISEVAQVPTG